MEPRALRWRPIDAGEVVPFSLGELEEAARNIGLNKAGGPDRIPPEAVKMAATIAGPQMLDMFNKLLQEQSFPRRWKEAEVVLIGKGKGGAVTDPAGYRPICLISVLGKLYERLLKVRLEREIDDKGGLSDRQYGFRRGRSTLDAVGKVLEIARESASSWVAMITVDIRNAFNTAPWEPILDNLAGVGISGAMLNCIDSYLSYRSVKTGKRALRTNMGVPQGSVLGPLLWNVLYDDLLRLRQEAGVTLIAFADDLAVLVESNSAEDLRWSGNEALRGIVRWVESNNMEIAPQKTEAIVLKGPRKRDGLHFRVGNVGIPCAKSVKYLGIMIDSSLLFGPHVVYAVGKAERSLAALTKILPNIGGPGHSKRRIIYGVVQASVLYGSPVWKAALRLDKYRKLLLGVQRRALIRVISGYRTMATVTAQVIAGVPPIVLLVEERDRVYRRGGGADPNVRAEERERTLQIWQAEWTDHSGTGAWTKKLIPNVIDWVKCRHRDIDFFLAQFLSGHGAFRQYTSKIKKTPNDICFYCGGTDTAEHTVLDCPRWLVDRMALQLKVGDVLSARNIVPAMMSSKAVWCEIHSFIRKVMERKTRDEWEHREGQQAL